MNQDITKTILPLKSLDELSSRVVDSINSLGDVRERLVEIVADGIIDENEEDDFKYILSELDRISLIAEELQDWIKHNMPIVFDTMP